ncbi:hypothetical protein ACLKA6_014798 [Drosophila palustris]
MASERVAGGGGGGRHARVSPTPGRGSKIAYTPCPRSEPPQDLDIDGRTTTARNCLAIPMSSLQTANGPPSSKASGSPTVKTTATATKVNKVGGGTSI